MKRTVILVGMVLALLCAWSSHVQAEEGKVAYVDLSRVFDSYKKTEKYDKDLEKKREVKQQEREKKVKEIKGLQDKMALLNDQEKEKTQSKIEEELANLENFDRDATMDLRKERDDFLKEILNEIQDAINEFAEKGNYTLILNDRVLLYGNPALDVTEQLIEVVNEKYNK
ncbi:OmpH family outer membrane protein [Candidatus Omnitrophota bacterium]